MVELVFVRINLKSGRLVPLLKCKSHLEIRTAGFSGALTRAAEHHG